MSDAQPYHRSGDEIMAVQPMMTPIPPYQGQLLGEDGHAVPLLKVPRVFREDDLRAMTAVMRENARKWRASVEAETKKAQAEVSERAMQPLHGPSILARFLASPPTTTDRSARRRAMFSEYTSKRVDHDMYQSLARADLTMAHLAPPMPLVHVTTQVPCVRKLQRVSRRENFVLLLLDSDRVSAREAARRLARVPRRYLNYVVAWYVPRSAFRKIEADVRREGQTASAWFATQRLP